MAFFKQRKGFLFKQWSINVKQNKRKGLSDFRGEKWIFLADFGQNIELIMKFHICSKIKVVSVSPTLQDNSTIRKTGK